jgi:SAM-dependent methyltransferase
MSNEEDINKAAVGHCFGNFHQYYSFHKAEDRMNLLPINFFNQILKENGQRNQFRLLDIGCNDGTLTWALFQRARMELPEHVDISVTGIDLDSELIDRANASFVTNENKNTVKFKAIDIINHLERNKGDDILNGKTFDLVSLFSITMWYYYYYHYICDKIILLLLL